VPHAVCVRRDTTSVSLAYYGALFAVVALVLSQALPLLLPHGIAVRIAHNSEGLVLALVVAGWIQYVRPRVAAAETGWLVTAGVAVACAVLGVALLLSDLPGQFKTLNETFLAAAVLIPYLQLRRPLPRGVAAWASAVTLVVVVVFNRTAIVTDLAETLAVLLLAPVAFDLVERGILDSTATTSRRLRAAWYVFLVAAPVCLSLLEYQLGVAGPLGEAVRYGVRVTEAFVCLILVGLFFSVVLGRTGDGSAAQAAVSSSSR
jgi:hypothetical protein